MAMVKVRLSRAPSLFWSCGLTDVVLLEVFDLMIDDHWIDTQRSGYLIDIAAVAPHVKHCLNGSHELCGESSANRLTLGSMEIIDH